MATSITLEITANNSNGLQVVDYSSYHNTLTGTDITIDWGDGTVEAYNGTIDHTYAEQGDYTVKISGATSTGQYFLQGNNNIIRAYVSSPMTSIGNRFLNDCKGLQEVSVGEGVQTIGNYFLFNSTKVSEITLPNTLTTINSEFCYNCNALEEVRVPYGVVTISTWFLDTCKGLKRVYIPMSVTSISSYFLEKCSALEEVHFESYTPPNLGTYSFRNTGVHKLYVPNKEMYKANSKYPSDDGMYHNYSLGESIAQAYALLKDILEDNYGLDCTGDGFSSMISKIREI